MQALRKTYNPFAADVADDIMQNIRTEHDYMDWASLSEGEIVEAFNQLVGIVATYKFNKDLSVLENRSELLSDIKTSMHGFLKAWAINEGFSQ